MTRKKDKKILQKIVFFAVIALILAAAFAMIINGGRSKNPRFVFGKAFLWVETGSMKPVIDERSYILVSKYNGEEIKKGDVIVFVCKDSSSPVYDALVVHRVESVTDDGYKTKGDANPAADTWTVKKDDIVATYNKNLPVMTFLGRIFSSGAGLIMVIAFSVGACAFVYVPDLIKAVKEITEEEREKEIEKRIKEEVSRLEKENHEKQNLEKENSEKQTADEQTAQNGKGGQP